MVTGILSDLTQGAKRLAEIKKDFSDLEFKETILELRELLLSAKKEILDRDTKLADLNAQLTEFERRRDKRSKLLEVEGFKYDGKQGVPDGLPYCPACEVREGGNLYRLLQLDGYFSKCPNCKENFNAGPNGRVHRNASMPQRTIMVGRD